MKKLSVLLSAALPVLLTVASLLFLPLRTEAYLYDGWGSVSPITDPGVDKPPGTGVGTSNLDILRAYHASDATNHYFRIDLQSVPASSNFIYGVAIGTDDARALKYTPLSGLPLAGLGADFLLLRIGNLQSETPTVSIQNRTSLNKDQSTALEWVIDKEKVGSRFDWVSFSYYAKGQGAYDLTPKTTVTPIPGAALLFSSGIVALAGLRAGRKMKKE